MAGELGCTPEALREHVEKSWKKYRCNFPKSLDDDAVLDDKQFLLLLSGYIIKSQDDYIARLKKQLVILDKLVEKQEEYIAIQKSHIDFLYNLLQPHANNESYQHNAQSGQKNKPAFVYLAQQGNKGNIFKIGVTQDITRREKTLKCGNAFLQIFASKQTGNAYFIETSLHQYYSQSRIYGEWFFLTDDDIDFLVNGLGFQTHLATYRR